MNKMIDFHTDFLPLIRVDLRFICVIRVPLLI
jgi:hypothetical protein